MIVIPAAMILFYHVWDLFCPSPLSSLHCPAISSISIPLMFDLTTVLFLGALGIGLAIVYVLPRLCMMTLRPGVTYPNFGFHYMMQNIIQGISNSDFFSSLFGDSSAIVKYLRYVGWNLNTVYQTGSNMGIEQKHDNPFLCNIGSGTMISDGLKMLNMQISATSFRLAESKIGDNNFLGNDISYPPNGRTGTNVLFGTKTLVPIDGPVREHVGLLGSPAFEIPRKVSRDRDMNESFDEMTRRARLRRKNVHNFVTALIFLASRWMAVFVAFMLGQATITIFYRFDIYAFLAFSVVDIAFNIAFFIVLERAMLNFKRLKPQLASIYDPYFWWHERYWKLNAFPILTMFAGTPFRGMLLRAMGMKVGSKLFDCSLGVTERSLTEVGDYANLNEGCVLQAHSLEEGVFKSDYIRLGNRCSLGPGAFVHYGVSTGDNIVLDADSFLMKGEILDSHTGWCGNPAKLLYRHVTQNENCISDVAMLTFKTSLPRDERQGLS